LHWDDHKVNTLQLTLFFRAGHHHHHVTQSSHSINAIGPAPLFRAGVLPHRCSAVHCSSPAWLITRAAEEMYAAKHGEKSKYLQAHGDTVMINTKQHARSISSAPFVLCFCIFFASSPTLSGLLYQASGVAQQSVQSQVSTQCLPADNLATVMQQMNWQHCPICCCVRPGM
jgi:hypothetical protein